MSPPRYCGDVGDICACCGQRIGHDESEGYICACTSGRCDECCGADDDDDPPLFLLRHADGSFT